MSINDSSRSPYLATAEKIGTTTTSAQKLTNDSRLGRLRLRTFGIDPKKTTFHARGFRGGTVAGRAQLECHAGAFVAGFNAAIAAREHDLAGRLGAVTVADRGFAYEGAAMAHALLDMLTPGSHSRLARLLSADGRPHRYMCHVGAGWALAVLRRRPGAVLRSFDPFIRWLAIDGYGFHEGFFHTSRSLAGKPPLRRPHGYEQRAFDQGLGRSLWFVGAGDVDAVATMIERFAPQRRPDLWSGLGLAAAYTTVATPADLRHLDELAGAHAAHVRQGAAFAVSARSEAGNVVGHTLVAADVLCGGTVEGVTALVNDARAELVSDATGAAYEQWRTRIRQRLTGTPTAVV
jgi:hypothetical protein